MEIIQITEEQANAMLVEIMDGQGDDSFLSFNDAIKSMKATGYIKQSALELARGAYIEATNSDNLIHIKYRLLIEYKAELEKALEEK